MLNLLLKVPLISSILIFLRPESVFRTLVNTSFFIFGTIFIFQRFLPFQYGKTYTKGKAYLRLEIPDRIAFLFVHSSAPIIFLYSYLFYYANSCSPQFNNYANNVEYIYHDAASQSSNNFYSSDNIEKNINSDIKQDIIDTDQNTNGIKNNDQNSIFQDQSNNVNSESKDINNNFNLYDSEDTDSKNNENENNLGNILANKKKAASKTENRHQNPSKPQLITFKSFMKAFISMPSILYLIHYVHRVLFYPWFRSKHSRPWPLESVIFFSLTSFVSGIIVSWSLFFKYRRFPILVQVILSILFLALIILSSFHDYYLCSLRQPGESGYRIPKGLLFNWVSCPHYTLELAAWFVFGFFLRGNLHERYLFWLIEFVNLSIRATTSTFAYRKMFNLKYPVRRNPILPIFYSPV